MDQVLRTKYARLLRSTNAATITVRVSHRATQGTGSWSSHANVYIYSYAQYAEVPSVEDFFTGLLPALVETAVAIGWTPKEGTPEQHIRNALLSVDWSDVSTATVMLWFDGQFGPVMASRY